MVWNLSSNFFPGYFFRYNYSFSNQPESDLPFTTDFLFGAALSCFCPHEFEPTSLLDDSQNRIHIWEICRHFLNTVSFEGILCCSWYPTLLRWSSSCSNLSASSSSRVSSIPSPSIVSSLLWNNQSECLTWWPVEILGCNLPLSTAQSHPH